MQEPPQVLRLRYAQDDGYCLGWRECKSKSKNKDYAGLGDSHPSRKNKGPARVGHPDWFQGKRRQRLLDAAFLVPGAVFLAGYSGVRGEPLAKVFDQFVDGGGLALFEAGFE